MIATAPGKLILTGEYAVLAGAPALVIAVDRRAVAYRRSEHPHGRPGGSSPFLVAVADEIARRLGPDHPAARAALEVSVDSSAFYQHATKLGLGSSAAVTVAATANALAAASADGDTLAVDAEVSTIDREQILAIAMAAHARAQEPLGARGSGADIAAAVHGGVIEYGVRSGAAPSIERRTWPAAVRLVPFFTGHAADTARLVASVAGARAATPAKVDAALAAVADASRAVCAVLSSTPRIVPADPTAPAVLAAGVLEGAHPMIAAFSLSARAIDQLAAATGVELVPDCVHAARAAMTRFYGTAKTTGAGGGDIGIAIVPSSADVTEVTRSLIEAKCQPLQLSIDQTGVDTRPGVQ